MVREGRAGFTLRGGAVAKQFNSGRLPPPDIAAVAPHSPYVGRRR